MRALAVVLIATLLPANGGHVVVERDATAELESDEVVVTGGDSTVGGVGTERTSGRAAVIAEVESGAAPSAVAQDEPVVVPGGEAFVRSVLAMGPASQDPYPGVFVASVAEQLSHEAAVDLPRRLRSFLDDLEELRAFLAGLDRRHGSDTASLAAPGRGAGKAQELLGWFGLEVRDIDGRRTLQRTVGDREARRRQILNHLGVSLSLQSRLWAEGEPIRIVVRDESSPLPLGAAVWQQQVFGRPLAGAELFRAFVDDERARDLLLGVAQLDRPTRELVRDAVGLRRLYQDARVAAGFRRLSPYLRAAGPPGAPAGGGQTRPASSGSGEQQLRGELRLPGGDRAAWEAVLGGWRDAGELITRLASRDGNRPAHLWRALSLLPEERAAYLLTLGQDDPAARGRWAASLAAAIRTPDFGGDIRWPDDVAELFVRLPFDADSGSIAWPGGARVWIAALRGDDPLDAASALDRLLATVSAEPDSGAAADARLLRLLIEGSDPDDQRPTAIRKFLAVSAAIRYQPIVSVQRAIPLLVRNYDRYGRAYGFLVTPVPLPAPVVEGLVRALRRLDAVPAKEARVEAIRKLQATLLLVHRLLLNDSLPADERAAILAELLDHELDPTLGYGPSFAAWWRDRLLAAVVRALEARGWPGADEERRAALVNGLVGGVAPAPIEVDGIPYRFAPAVIAGRRLQTHVGQQQLPRLDLLLRLDEIAATLADGERAAPAAGAPTAPEVEQAAVLEEAAEGASVVAVGEQAALAEEIETTLADIRERLPSNVFELDDALPVPVAREETFRLGEHLAAQLRGAAGDRQATAAAFRRALTSYLGDALVGLVYALHMGDPQSFLYQHEHIAWLHQLGPVELPGGVPESLYGPWAQTLEGWVDKEGNRLRNSLFGVPARLGRWNLQTAMPPGAPRVDLTAEAAWGEALAYLDYTSFDADTQRRVSRRQALGASWVAGAARSRDAGVPPPRWSGGEAPVLEAVLRRLLRPHQVQGFLDAVAAGRAAEATEMISPGNAYLVGRLLDGGESSWSAVERWRLDQAVGMPLGRSGDYVGLGHPPMVPYGEAGDRVADPLLYARLLDVRVALAVGLERQLLPATLAARLLPDAMARVLSAARSNITGAWRGMLDGTVEAVTETAVREWVVDLAFDDELLLPEELAAATGGAAAPGGLDAGVAGAAGRETSEAAAAGRRPRAPATALTLPGAEPAQRPQFEARVDLVLVDVAVLDDDGRFVTDLAAEEFVVRRDGQPVEPAFVRLEGNPSPSLVLDPLPADVAERVEPAPRNLVLVADLHTTPPPDWERMLLDATDFLRSGVAVQDRVALVAIGQRGDVQAMHDFTLDHESVAAALETLRGDFFGSGTLFESIGELSRILCDNSICFDENPDNCQAQSTGRFANCITNATDFEEFKVQQAISQLGRFAAEERQKAQIVLQALEQITSMVQLGDPLDRSKVIVLLSGGFELRPGDVLYDAVIDYVNTADQVLGNEARNLISMLTSGRRDLRQDLRELTEALHACHCTMYTIGTLGQAAIESRAFTGAFSPVVSSSALRRGLQDSLNALARDTGGRPFFGSDPSVGFRDILEDTRLRYVIGFVQPPGEAAADSVWHEIEVEVTRSDLDVRARPGFYWPPRR